jgi:hypothetical protein
LNFQRALRFAIEQPDGREGTYYYHMGLAQHSLGRGSAALLAFQQALRTGAFPEMEATRREFEAARQAMFEQRRPPERGG